MCFLGDEKKIGVNWKIQIYIKYVDPIFSLIGANREKNVHKLPTLHCMLTAFQKLKFIDKKWRKGGREGVTTISSKISSFQLACKTINCSHCTRCCTNGAFISTIALKKKNCSKKKKKKIEYRKVVGFLTRQQREKMASCIL